MSQTFYLGYVLVNTVNAPFRHYQMPLPEVLE